MDHKAVETTHNVNNALCPGTANKNIHALHYSAVVVQEILQRRWEPWKWEAQWLATRSWQWPTEWIIKADPLTTSQEIAEELNANPSKWWTTCIWSKLERWKNSISGWLMSWPQLKSSSFWSVIFSYSMQQWIISWSDCDMRWKVDFMQQPAMVGLQLSGWTKKLQSTFKTQTCTKKSRVTVWWSAASLIDYSFLNPEETITSEKDTQQQIDEMSQKLHHLQPTLVNRKDSILLYSNVQPNLEQPML